jgi:hypothetical protein
VPAVGAGREPVGRRCRGRSPARPCRHQGEGGHVRPAGTYPRGVFDLIAALVPSAGLLFLFWRALKALVEADRRERIAQARHDRREADLAAAAVGPDGGDDAVPGETGHVAGAASGPTVSGADPA